MSLPRPADDPSAPRLLDLDAWPRRAAFDFFRRFERPVFDLCTRVDVAPLKAALRAHGGGIGLSLACTGLALAIANRHPAFRLRLDEAPDGEARVLEYPVVHGSTTVVRDDGGFGFAYLEADDDLGRFAARAQAAVAAVREAPRETAWAPRGDERGLIYFTALPWVHFTSFTHARQPGLADAIPRVAFGRADPEGARLMLPLALQVHHALMDGFHVGRFVQDFEAACATPRDWLGAAA